MTHEAVLLETIDNPSDLSVDVEIPGAVLLLGGFVVGSYVGLLLGGPLGASVGSLAGTFCGLVAASTIKWMRVCLHADGRVEVEYETYR